MHALKTYAQVADKGYRKTRQRRTETEREAAKRLVHDENEKLFAES